MRGMSPRSPALGELDPQRAELPVGRRLDAREREPGPRARLHGAPERSDDRERVAGRPALEARRPPRRVGGGDDELPARARLRDEPAPLRVLRIDAERLAGRAHRAADARVRVRLRPPAGPHPPRGAPQTPPPAGPPPRPPPPDP